MDELERHIRDHREEMDIHEPDPALWNRIEKRLPGKERKLRRLLWRAAVVLIVAGTAMTAVVSVNRMLERINDPQAAAVRETYYYYDSQIKMLYEEAQPLLTANPDIDTELRLGMEELDSLTAGIIRDLNDNIASSEVLEALVRNYRLRIELLEETLQLMRENDEGTEKTGEHEL